MSNEIVQFTIPDIEKMALAIAKSNLFGIKTPDQAMALMLIAQAEGRHPVEAARDYNIIQGRPAKTADAMLRDFLSSGGKVEWHTLTNEKADATFSHPNGGTLRIDWDMARAKIAGLGGKDMWTKYPRQMLRSRTISEGVRSVCPAATSGMYVPEEVKDFDDKPMKDVTPVSSIHPIDETAIKLESEAQNAAAGGSETLVTFLKGLEKGPKAKLLAKIGHELKATAKKVDQEKEADESGSHQDTTEGAAA